jgi:signal transduction histidine kinase/DNA-binding response OmpR family regulator
MKLRIGYFFWILMLAFGLMILVVAAQVLTKRNINGLKVGNKEAVITFTINNRLQELVNLSFELNAKMVTQASKSVKRQSLLDSLNMMGYRSSVLEKLNASNTTRIEFEHLNDLISQQVEYSMQILQEKNDIKRIDSLQKMKIVDSVYSSALLLQKHLEKDLQQTLNKNTEASSFLSAYNKTLAIIAIVAVFILCTIIINRHIRQRQLIEQLEAATAAARESALIKDQFLANMSHEIRTPLNAIKGFSHLLAQTDLGPDQQKYTAIINESSSNLLHIVNDILDISKMEAGKLRITNKEFDLYRILQTTEQMFGNAANEKGLTYSQSMQPDVPLKVMGDPDRLLQILINLISNGIKFTNKGFVKIIVAVAQRDDTKIWIEFLVEDTGMGIPGDKKEEVFKRFEQLHTGKDAVIQGTGLGLSIVKNLAMLMGGEVTLKSEFGKGTSFKVLLPFTESKSVEHLDEQMASNLETDSYFPDAVVLVAEDNKVNQLLIRSVLNSYKITAEIVENGEDVIKAVSKRRYHLILMDIQMPIMDGYDTTELLRKQMNLTTPIIAMTAFALPGEREKCLQAGMNDYLAKPIDMLQLQHVLKKHLGEKENMYATTIDSKNHINFILQLSGGDVVIAQRILKQIQNEMPVTSAKLAAMYEKEEYDTLKPLLHHMVSTFSPLGNETTVIKEIEMAKEELEQDNPDYKTTVSRLLAQIKILEEESIDMMDNLNQLSNEYNNE